MTRALHSTPVPDDDRPLPTKVRYCEQCGRSVRPLDVPHVQRACEECGRDVYVVTPGEGGGIRVEPGDTFTIPRGWLTISLDPAKSRGRLFRHGVSWYVRQILTAGIPATPDADVEAYLESYYKQADDVLETSPKLAHLDLETEEGGEAASKIIEDGSVEWWAMFMGASVLMIRDAIEARAIEDAVAATARLQVAHSMLMYLKHLDEHVWTGYRHMQQVYDIAAAAARTPREAELIQALRPTFAGMDEDVLHTWVESGVAIGSRIGVTDLDESLVRELARFHLNQFDRRRRDEEIAAERRDRVWRARREGAVATAGVAEVRLEQFLHRRDDGANHREAV
jgi:hypothetical protein